ncbi:MAG: aminodeoxychorismate synthase component I [Thermodesulfobacteriota bacterium]|nr:aminodeoxychorismate synthase component I [Thermodesulfobacteriota bacterium]
MKIDDRSFLVIHDADRQRWLRFEHPRLVVEATTVAQVVSGLQQVEEAVHDHEWYAAGFVGYQAAAAFDPRLVTVSGGTLPLMWFGLYETVTTIELSTLESVVDPLLWSGGVEKNSYLNAIDSVKQYIASGDTYQVNYTYPLQCRFEADPWAFFVQLQQAQRGDYGAYIDLGRNVICSASPELFFSRIDDVVTTRPMKGTAPRGRDGAEDIALSKALSLSTKDRAENLMIVDMLRNDLGRIARLGTISVDKLFAVERYPTLWQMTTEVRAQSDCTITELFSALFPCASITGAPKVRTMEIIAELEQSPRQIYTGSIGFITPDGRAQFNVAIRTALIDRQQQLAEYRVGGGIVWDSHPEQEYAETRTKAKVLHSFSKDFKLLETLLWEPESGYRLLEEHLQRLMVSAAYFGYPVDVNLLRQGLIDAAAARLPQRWRVRCLVDGHGQHQLQFVPQPYRQQTTPLRVAMARRQVDSGDPLLYHKTDQRQRYELLLQEVAQADSGIDDVVMINERSEVTETTIANIVIYKDGRYLTPPLYCGLLPGTMRQALLTNGTIVEQVIHVDDLQTETPLYLINSVRGWRWAQLQLQTFADKKTPAQNLRKRLFNISLNR